MSRYLPDPLIRHEGRVVQRPRVHTDPHNSDQPGGLPGAAMAHRGNDRDHAGSDLMVVGPVVAGAATVVKVPTARRDQPTATQKEPPAAAGAGAAWYPPQPRPTTGGQWRDDPSGATHQEAHDDPDDYGP